MLGIPQNGNLTIITGLLESMADCKKAICVASLGELSNKLNGLVRIRGDAPLAALLPLRLPLRLLGRSISSL